MEKLIPGRININVIHYTKYKCRMIKKNLPDSSSGISIISKLFIICSILLYTNTQEPELYMLLMHTLYLQQLTKSQYNNVVGKIQQIEPEMKQF